MKKLKFAYTVSEIAQILSSNCNNDVPLIIDELHFDSRKTPLNAQNAIFFALQGSQRNGHFYLNEAYSKGIRCFVVAEIIDEKDFPNAIFILVDNTLRALQKLAKFHRKLYDRHLLAITGSNGKTIIKEWLYHLLHSLVNVSRSPKSFNSQIGVPLSLILLDEKTELGIIEAGISQPDEMDFLENMIAPQLGILSHMGDAHQANFDSHLQKIKEKLKLFRNAGYLIHRYDLELNAIIANELPQCKTFRWGSTSEADVQIVSQQTKANLTQIFFRYADFDDSILIPFTNESAVENAISALCFMLLFETGKYFVAEKFRTLPPVSMRLELKSARFNSLIINDSYNSDLNSVAEALEFLNQQAGIKQKVLIISDILQSIADVQLYTKLGLLIQKYRIDIFIGIGQVISSWQADLKALRASFFYATTEDFLQEHKITQLANSIILLKGARQFRFEKIAHWLESKHHSTRLEVNLSAMVANLNIYRALLHQQTKVMVMVKAYSYGNGTLEIARMLEYQKVDFLAVAYANEGVELKNAGISLPVMVMNPAPEDFDQILEYSLMPEIYSWSVLYAFVEKLKEFGLRNYPVHLKFDTGMSRLGFCSSDVLQLIDFLKKQESIKVISVFSHLASAEDVADDDFSHRQINLFLQISQELEIGLGYKLIKHILNSAGIERFPQAQFDMVRLGIGLYGATSGSKLPLQNISSLKTIVSQIKELNAGDTVGYNRRGIMKTSGRIATIPIGYADGFSRALSNGVGSVWINGKEAPVVGSVCMDMTMVDVSGLNVEEGDEVEIFGSGMSIDKMASLRNTISYEVLTSISGRVKRIYFYE